VPKLRLRVQQQLYGPAALRAVSGLANETSKPGLPRGKVFPPYINNAPPLIDSVQIPSSFVVSAHTFGAYSELPEPVARDFDSATSSLKLSAKRSCDPKCAATSKAAGRSPAECGSSQAVFCSASGRPNNSAALVVVRERTLPVRLCQRGALSIESYVSFPPGDSALSSRLKLGRNDVQ